MRSHNESLQIISRKKEQRFKNQNKTVALLDERNFDYLFQLYRLNYTLIELTIFCFHSDILYFFQLIN